MKPKLSQWKELLAARHQSKRPADENEEAAKQRSDVPYVDLWQEYGVKPYWYEGDYCLVRETSYPLAWPHGRYRLGDLYDVHRRWQEAPFSHPLSCRGLAVSDLFFFDTETMGLSSGVGNVMFLLGHARVLGDRVVVRQHVLPYPGAEAALYQSFLSDVDYTTLVTYNGKAFDWPRLKTRHALVRDVVPRLPSFGHFDLYHAARRLWKDALDSLRLEEVERSLLSIERGEDVPGFLAPMMYKEFLHTPHPDRMMPILRHNENDVLSLISLYIHLSIQLLEAAQLADPREQLAAARWLEAVGETAAARNVYEQASGKEAKEAEAAKWQLSLLYRREKRYEEAAAIWRDLLAGGNARWKVKAGLELAKAYEHHFRDAKAAHRYAVMAYEAWRPLARASRECSEKEEMEWRKRLARLERKKAKSSFAHFPGKRKM
ncbi:ribonuclease H-like domain-containing protein [Caldibacillus thermoamylovorans]